MSGDGCHLELRYPADVDWPEFVGLLVALADRAGFGPPESDDGEPLRFEVW